MRFYTAIIDEKETVMVECDKGFSAGSERVVKLSDLGFDYKDMTDVICHMGENDIKSLKDLISKMDSDKFYDVSDIKLCAPIVRPRQDVLCLGINYDEHAAEAKKFSEEAFGGERPATIYFSKRVNEATAPYAEIPSYPGLVDSLDYEVELGVIIGKDVKNVSAEEALDYVFGYTIVNDVSARNLQTKHKQWYVGKSLDGFTPIGPAIVTADEIEDIQSLDIECFVNGEQRQKSNTKYMIQTVAGAIAELSKGMTLQAGTIIATGTPAGVGMGMVPPTFLNVGDKIICRIEKIGTLENVVGR